MAARLRAASSRACQLASRFRTASSACCRAAAASTGSAAIALASAAASSCRFLASACSGVSGMAVSSKTKMPGVISTASSSGCGLKGHGGLHSKSLAE